MKTPERSVEEIVEEFKKDIIEMHYETAGRWFLVGLDGQKELNEGEVNIKQVLESWCVPFIKKALTQTRQEALQEALELVIPVSEFFTGESDARCEEYALSLREALQAKIESI